MTQSKRCLKSSLSNECFDAYNTIDQQGDGINRIQNLVRIKVGIAQEKLLISNRTFEASERVSKPPTLQGKWYSTSNNS